MFVGFGLLAVVLVLHGVNLYGVEQMQECMGLYWVILQGSLYILGAGIYAVCSQVPRQHTNQIKSTDP
jgi:adiponectin receptor